MVNKLFFYLLILIFPGISHSGGVFGDALNLVVPGLGTKLDNAHRDIKKAVPVYGKTEEEVSAEFRRLGNQQCSHLFNGFTIPLIAHCSNYGGRLQGRKRILDTKNFLISTNIFTRKDFSGVEIRSCPLTANGTAPDRNRIYLDDDLLIDSSHILLMEVLAHEMFHISQYKSMGTDSFKCNYVQSYLKCGLCKDERNSLEKQAYDFQATAMNRVFSHFDKQVQVGNSNLCAYNGGNCILPSFERVGKGCSCDFGEGKYYGNIKRWGN